MYEQALIKNISDFLGYFKGLTSAPSGTPEGHWGTQCIDAIALLEPYKEKIQKGAFSKEDAQEMQGMLTKGIGDWEWPEEAHRIIDQYSANLCALLRAEYPS